MKCCRNMLKLPFQLVHLSFCGGEYCVKCVKNGVKIINSSYFFLCLVLHSYSAYISFDILSNWDKQTWWTTLPQVNSQHENLCWFVHTIFFFFGFYYFIETKMKCAKENEFPLNKQQMKLIDFRYHHVRFGINQYTLYKHRFSLLLLLLFWMVFSIFLILPFARFVILTFFSRCLQIFDNLLLS